MTNREPTFTYTHIQEIIDGQLEKDYARKKHLTNDEAHLIPSLNYSIDTLNKLRAEFYQIYYDFIYGQKIESAENRASD